MTDFAAYPLHGPPVKESRPSPPPAVLNAAKLMYVGAVLGILGLAVNLVNRSQIKKNVIHANPTASVNIGK
jgi:hypothetical protein